MSFKFVFLFICLQLQIQVAKSQHTASVIGNSGNLTRVLISDFSKEIAVNNDLPCQFVAEGVKVCLVRNILSSSRSSITAKYVGDKDNMVSSEMNHIDSMISSFLAKPGNVDSIELYTPLNLNGYFTCLEVNGTIIDYAEINPKERWDVIQFLGEKLINLKWDTSELCWKSDVDLIKVKSWKASAFSENIVPDLVSKVLSKSVARSILIDDSKIEYCGSDSYDVRTQTVEWRIVCPDFDSIDCKNIVSGYISEWAQDEWLTRGNGILYARKRPLESLALGELLQRHADQICNSNSNAVDLLHLKGGNYFVRGNLIFIGRKELYNLLYCSNWWSLIGATSKPTQNQIEKWLKKAILPQVDSTNIIWVGDSERFDTAIKVCKPDPNEDQYQPLYHIDLFMHPLGFIDSENTGHFYYYVDTLINDFHKTDQWNRFQRIWYQLLQDSVSTAGLKLKKQIEALDLVAKPIHIPLLLDFVGNGGQKDDRKFVSFVNGHSSVTSDSVKFYMPNYTDTLSYSRVHYKKALQMAIDAAKCNGKVKVVLINGVYGYKSALHCIVKEIERD